MLPPQGRGRGPADELTRFPGQQNIKQGRCVNCHPLLSISTVLPEGNWETVGGRGKGTLGAGFLE